MIYRFETCELDLTRGSLHTANREVELRPKSFAVLRHLIENAGRLISKDELVTAVWSQAVVTDDTLARCISDVRAAIADRDHRVIKTVPRRGYLFAAEVVRGEHAPGWRDMAGEAAASERALEDRPSIAVLAFSNMSGDPSQDYFSDGITEDIITELSRFSELLVIARNSSFRYKGLAIDIRMVGRELGVRYVLEGSIRREGDRIRISAQLIDAQDGVHRWAERFDRKVEDMLALQIEIASTIVATVAAHVRKAEAARALTKPHAAWQAHDYYMMAKAKIATYHSTIGADDLFDARRLLGEALAIDPACARAYSELAMTYVYSWVHPFDGDFLNPAALERGYASAATAVRLGPNLHEAHAGLGWILVFKRQHDVAVAAFERAAALNPSSTNWRYAFALVLSGRSSRAIDVLSTHMRLDPFYDPSAPGTMGFAHYMLERYVEALPHLQECASRAPSMRLSHLWLAATYAQLGDLERARSEADAILRIEPSYTINGTARILLPFKRAADAEHFFTGLIKAGIPEG